MKTLIILLLASVVTTAQIYRTEYVKGDVKFRSGTDESWIVLYEGSSLNNDAVVVTGSNSSVRLVGDEVKFELNENSAVSVNSIKKMSLGDLLLALAMEDLMNAPKTNNNGSSKNTATYGTEENGEENALFKSNSFGMKRLNGAMQLANSGLLESAVVFAKETYRKYPDTKSETYYRVYFANILYEKGLYEEALVEYNDIVKLDLSDAQKENVDSVIGKIKKIMMSN